MKNYKENSMYKSSPIPLFYPGLMDSNFYRIPSLLALSDGTMVAGADQRLETRSDWGKINPVLVFRKNGEDFHSFTKVIDMDARGTSAAPFNIDMALAESKKHSKLYMLVDAFKSGGNFWACEAKDAYKNIEGIHYLKIFDQDKNEFYIKENGEVYDQENQKTDLRVKLCDTMPFSELYNIYQNKRLLGNIFKDNCPYQVQQTSYLWALTSTDYGRTWQCPVDISSQVAEPGMKFLGTGPGVGIELANGRILFPIYYSIEDKDENNRENAALIYTDDGVNFSRSRAINYEKNGEGLLGDLPINCSESQLVELNNGHVLIFFRNTSGAVRYGISTDFGETFSKHREVDFASTSTCMVSVLKIERGGKEYILLSNPDGPDRSHGSVKILEVLADDRLRLVGKKPINSSHFGYSCLASTPKKDTYALVYEQEHKMDDQEKDLLIYTEFDQDWLFA